MKIHVYGQNKPSKRYFDSQNNYHEIRSASYSGHRIAENMQQAQQYMQEFIKRDWDVQVSVE